ncbi:putative carbonic anhydrase 3 [Argiope bruennichi]|uniref:Carbonic anhydrase n=1 Tax=Argiope bruennichi TaxID=94029 RepID=A0A8T0E222_ARGBR|nr:putative carbonic anhydrase 3 [Argiope bruennichi]KAF8763344.1 putative carbonic anhydrase 3 like protein [Argiope bruennichi]
MFRNCGGSQQSPVDIDTEDALKSAFLKPLEFHGYDRPLRNAVILNNGHTVLIKAERNSDPPFIKGGGLDGKYTFRQLHFHWGSSNDKGSEHRIDGKSYPGELHIVHEKNGETGDLAVVAVFLEISKRKNLDLEPIITSLPKVSVPGPVVPIKKSFQLAKMLPKDAKHYYRYVGSLTTPPCTEGVTWTILATPVRIGEHQLKAFRRLRASSGSKHFLSDNFRLPQELHQRIILESIIPKARGVSDKQKSTTSSQM